MKFRVTTVFLVLALAVAACGGDEAETTTSQATSTTAQATTTTKAPTTTSEATTTTSEAGEDAPMTPADHEGRTECLVCHESGVAGAPMVPEVPDHSGLDDDSAVCFACHALES